MRQIVLLISLVILLASQAAIGQQNFFMDQLFFAVSSKETQWTRKITQRRDTFLTEDFDSQTLLRTGIYTNLKSIDEVNEFFSYYKGSQYKLKKQNKFDGAFGIITSYNSNGQKSGLRIFKDHEVLTCQLWSEEGEPSLLNGTGKVFGYSKEEVGEHFEIYRDSLLIESFVVRDAQRDTIRLVVDEVAKPRNGIESFYREFTRILNYPFVARLANTEGKVLISFVVSNSGALTDFRALTSIGSNLEEKSIKKLSKLPPWEPAIWKGRPVSTSFTIPIIFKLY